LGVVWFELSWVGLFGLMDLIGASLMSSLSSRELCIPSSIVKGQLVTSAILVSPCSSAQVLGVFLWMPAIFLIAYVTLLSIIAYVRSKDDSLIWRCAVRDVPVDKILGEVKRRSILSLPPIRKTPVIHAPRPRYIIPPLLDCSSARNSAYDGPAPISPPKPAPVREMKSWYKSSPSQGPYTGFYNTSIQKALGGPLPQLPLHVDKPGGTRPLGDWPRLDATSRPRTKRRDRVDPEAQFPPVKQQQQSTAPRRLSLSTTTTPFVDRSTVSAGGGISYSQGSSMPVRRPQPPPLDLSQISTHRTRSQRSRARAGR